jgi:hypothetical protein
MQAGLRLARQLRMPLVGHASTQSLEALQRVHRHALESSECRAQPARADEFQFHLGMVDPRLGVRGRQLHPRNFRPLALGKKGAREVKLGIERIALVTRLRHGRCQRTGG